MYLHSDRLYSVSYTSIRWCIFRSSLPSRPGRFNSILENGPSVVDIIIIINIIIKCTDQSVVVTV